MDARRPGRSSGNGPIAKPSFSCQQVKLIRSQKHTSALFEQLFTHWQAFNEIAAFLRCWHRVKIDYC
jgi:hypothetical protein